MGVFQALPIWFWRKRGESVLGSEGYIERRSPRGKEKKEEWTPIKEKWRSVKGKIKRNIKRMISRSGRERRSFRDQIKGVLLRSHRGRCHCYR
jgi:hypothetical protein